MSEFLIKDKRYLLYFGARKLSDDWLGLSTCIPSKDVYRISIKDMEKDMYLMSLVYASAVSENFHVNDIKDILENARNNNKKNGVTGILCFNGKMFLQCLEGSRTSVNNIYSKIVSDTRHDKIALLEYNEITEREFDTWAMGYVPESTMTAATLLKYSGSETFDPFKMSGSGALRLLCALKRTIPTQ